MNRDPRKITLASVGRVTTAALLVISLSGASLTTAMAADSSTGSSTTTSQSATSSTNSTSTSSTSTSSTSNKSADVTTTTKDETVYVFVNPDGSVKNTVVSDWLQNVDQSSTLQDVSNLSGITNTEGNQAYTTNSDGTISWAADGSDIYYQGSSNEQAPITMKVTYTLDGQTVTPDEIAGKSGKVTIRFDYTNNSYTDEVVNGATQRVYTPFVVITGLVLDNENFSNVQVTNGKTVNDGDRTIITGYAMPGMQHNLGLDKDTVDIPEYIEVTADASDFKMNSTGTIVTNEFFNDMDTDKLDANEIEDGINQLESGMSQLLSGSSSLTDGLNQLASGASAVDSGAQTLNSGASQLSSGTSQLQSSTSIMSDSTAKLAAAAAQVNGGLDQLTNGTSTSTGLKDAVTSIGNASTSGTLLNGTAQISGGISQVIGTNGGSATASTGLWQAYYASEGIAAGTDPTSATSAYAAAAGIDQYLQGMKTGVTAATANLGTANGYLTSASQAIGAAQTALAGASLTEVSTALGTASKDLGTASTDLGTASTDLDTASTALGTVSDPSEANNALAALQGIAGDTTLTASEKAAITQAETALQDSATASSSAATAKSAADTAQASADTAQASANAAKSSADAAVTAIANSNVTTALTYLAGASQAVGGASQYVSGVSAALTALNGTVDIGAGDKAALSDAIYLTEQKLEPGLKTINATATAVANGLYTQGNYQTAIPALTYINSGVSSLTSGLTTLKSGGTAPDGRTSAGLQGAVDALGSSSTENTLLYGTDQIASGTQALAAASPALVSGIEQLNSGASQLSAGTSKLAANTPTLASGAQTAAAGAQTLQSGLQQYNDEGIQKIVDAYNDNLAGLSDRMHAMVNAGKDYNTFSGKSTSMDGTVKFIYETDAINED